jgi:Phage major capsid protein E
MPPILNPFEANGFTMAVLSRAISVMPIQYGRLGKPFIVNGQAYELFPFEGITTRSVALDFYEGLLTLLDFKPVGSPGTVGEDGERVIRSFTIPFIPHDNTLLPSEVQGVRALGGTQFESMQAMLLRKLQTMRNKHEITHEFMRAGALKGKIYQPNGTLLYNLYSEFGGSEKTIGFALATATTEILTKCMEVKDWIEENLGGDEAAGIYCLCGYDFFRKLVTHAKVKDEYQRWRQGAFPGGDYRNRFEYCGIVFEQYLGKAKTGKNVTKKFVEDSEARFFPVGTSDTFRQYAAPGDFNETVNTIGERIYAKVAPVEMERGYKLHTQSSPLALCCRPKTLVRATVAA